VLMKDMRKAILAGQFQEFATLFFEKWEGAE
jgi:queuine/archaeosine tRNA-ribosyltransferase